jgi:hypothetical protein
MGLYVRDRRRRYGGVLAIFAGAIVALAAAASAPACAATPFVWSPRELIDHQQPFTSNHVMTAVSCPSRTLCVAADNEGRILTSRDPAEGSTATWSITQIDRDNEISGISCPSTRLCVAVDYPGDVVTSTDPARGAAARWTVHTVPGATELRSVSCPSRSLCVAVGSGEYLGTHNLILASTDPWRGGRAHWSVKRLGMNNNRIFEPSGLKGVSCPTTTLCVADEEELGILTSTDPARGVDATWSKKQPYGSYTVNGGGVSCPSRSFCDVDGKLTSTDPGAGSHARWVLRSEGQVEGSGMVSCVSRSLCVDPLREGGVEISTNPLGRSPHWSMVKVDEGRETAGMSCLATMCVGLDRHGRTITSTDPTAGARSQWAVVDVDGFNYLSDVSCTSAPLCVAVDHDGTVLTTTDPLGGPGTWRARNVDGTKLFNAVSCVGESLCVAADSAGDAVTSTDPGAGGSASWTVKNIDGSHSLVDVSCATEFLCVAIDDSGNVLTSTDPRDGPTATWSVLTVVSAPIDAGRLTALACPTASLCVAVDYEGQVRVTTDPQLGAQATWASLPRNVDDVEWEDISCPSSSMCVIVGPEVMTLTNPGTSSASLKHKLLPLVNQYSEADEVHGVSCPSSSFCLAVEGRGNAVRSTDPERGSRAKWRVTSVDRLHALWSVSCASASLCVAVDDHGYAFVAHRPGAVHDHGPAPSPAPGTPPQAVAEGLSPAP